jgi:hypothetical protein
MACRHATNSIDEPGGSAMTRKSVSSRPVKRKSAKYDATKKTSETSSVENPVAASVKRKRKAPKKVIETPPKNVLQKKAKLARKRRKLLELLYYDNDFNGCW